MQQITIKENYTITRTSTHAPGAEKICVTETTASAARSASVCGAGGCQKNGNPTEQVTHTRVIILLLLTHKTYRDFRYGFLTDPRSIFFSRLSCIKLNIPQAERAFCKATYNISCYD